MKFATITAEEDNFPALAVAYETREELEQKIRAEFPDKAIKMYRHHFECLDLDFPDDPMIFDLMTLDVI